jgi:hypothetical protein
VLDPVLQLDQLALQPEQLLEVGGAVDRLRRAVAGFTGGLRIPELLELAFAELKFELFVQAVAELGIDALAQGLVAGRFRSGHLASSVGHALLKFPSYLTGI